MCVVNSPRIKCTALNIPPSCIKRNREKKSRFVIDPKHMDFTYSYQRSNAARGLPRPPNFQSILPEVLFHVCPDLKLRAEFMQPDAYETEISNVPSLSEHGTNTLHTSTLSTGMLHAEGGWPRDVDPQQEEHTSRYKRKAEKDEAFLRAVAQLESSLLPVIRQNAAIDIYDAYEFPSTALHGGGAAASRSPSPASQMQVDPTSLIKGSDPQHAKRLVEVGGSADDDGRSAYALCAELLAVRCTITDPLLAQNQTRVVSCTDWHTAEALRSRVAVTLHYPPTKYANTTQVVADHTCLDSYVFDLNAPHIPEVAFQPPAPLNALKFCPRELHLLGGGCSNGVVCLFDMRRGGPPTAVTPLSALQAVTGACCPVTSFQWMHVSSKTLEIFCCNGSHVCQVWDARKLSAPVDAIRVATRSASGVASSVKTHNAYCSDYCESTVGPGKFIVGADTGTIFTMSRRGRSEGDHVQTVHGTHHGPTASVQHHPTLPKFFASCGDWTVRIWHEEVRAPILSTFYHTSMVVDCAWHPFRPNILVCLTDAGVVELWDLLVSHEGAVASMKLNMSGAHCLSFDESGCLLSVGGSGGAVVVLRLHPAFAALQTSASTKESTSRMLEHEVTRLRLTGYPCSSTRERTSDAAMSVLPQELDEGAADAGCGGADYLLGTDDAPRCLDIPSEAVASMLSSVAGAFQVASKDTTTEEGHLNAPLPRTPTTPTSPAAKDNVPESPSTPTSGAVNMVPRPPTSSKRSSFAARAAPGE